MKINWYHLKELISYVFMGTVGALVSAVSLNVMTPLTLNPATWVLNIILLIAFVFGATLLIVALIGVSELYSE